MEIYISTIQSGSVLLAASSSEQGVVYIAKTGLEIHNGINNEIILQSINGNIYKCTTGSMSSPTGATVEALKLNLANRINS